MEIQQNQLVYQQLQRKCLLAQTYFSPVIRADRVGVRVDFLNFGFHPLDPRGHDAGGGTTRGGRRFCTGPHQRPNGLIVMHLE